LQKAAHQLAGGEFNPQIRQLQRQQKNQDAQYQAVEDRSDSYYNQLRGYGAMAQAGLQQSGNQGVLQSAVLGQQTEQQLARSRAAIQTPGSGGAQSLLNQEAALQQMRAASDAQGYTQAASLSVPERPGPERRYHWCHAAPGRRGAAGVDQPPVE
jgi:hypothetical protein